MDIMTLLGVLSQSVDQTAIKRLGQIATAMITMSAFVKPGLKKNGCLLFILGV